MPTKQIIIEDGHVKVLGYEVLSSIPLDTFIQRAAINTLPFVTKQLPTNCIKYEKSTKFEKYYILVPEDNYKLSYNGDIYIVRLPNTVFTFCFTTNKTELIQSVMMFWTESSVVDLDKSNFFVPPLHNIYDDGKICAGGDGVKSPKNQSDFIMKYILLFFSNAFNDDLSSGKRRMNKVAEDQRKLVPFVEDDHVLIQCWWKVAEIKENKYSFSEPVAILRPAVL
jgi:hypothetical protein